MLGVLWVELAAVAVAVAGSVAIVIAVLAAVGAEAKGIVLARAKAAPA